jgi:hypothetical protein
MHGNAAVKNTTQFLYDAMQRLIKVTNPDGSNSQAVYSGDNLSYTLDEKGTRYNYCAPCGLLTSMSGPLGDFLPTGTIIGLRHGPVLLQIWPTRGADTTAIAGMNDRLAYDEHPSSIAVDSIDIGAGVVDNLVRSQIEGLRPINVSSARAQPRSRRQPARRAPPVSASALP